MKKSILLSMLASVCSIAFTPALAKNIDLLSEPNVGSKVTGKIDTEKVVTLVYTPKNGEWIKVANPDNGDVGWIKSNELGTEGLNMQVTTSNNGSRSYSFFKINDLHHASNNVQLSRDMQMIELQQNMVQRRMETLINNMFDFPFNYSQPIIVPVILQPSMASPQKGDSVTSAKQAKNT